MARAIAQETQQLETDLNEERSRYQNLLTEHLRLEEKYDNLKEVMASSVSDTHRQAMLKRGFMSTIRHHFSATQFFLNKL